MIKEIKYLMDSIVSEWAVCGGDAIDLFVGKKTRNHKDIDIAVFWKDREILIEKFIDNGFRVFEPDKGLLREITSIQNDLCTEDNLWCIKSENSSYNIENVQGNFYKITTERKDQNTLDFVELLFNRKENNLFLYKRNINISLVNAICYSKENIPYLAPEMVLLYKSSFIKLLESDKKKDIETVVNYRHDFEISVNLLNKNQRDWLKNALNISYPNGHEWLLKI